MTSITLSPVSRSRVEAGLSFISLAPRVLVPLGSLLAALLGTTSCVPAARYEEAQSAAEVEGEARRRASLELTAANSRILALSDELRARDGQIDAREKNLEQTKLERSVVEKERDETLTLVEQLRSELSRAGDHLAAFSQDKTRLERELASARGSGMGIDPLLVLVARDAGVAIGAAKLQASISLGMQSDALLVRVRAEALFESESSTPSALAKSIFDVTARYALHEPRLSVLLREADFDATGSPSVSRERRERLSEALAARGVDQRIAFEPRDPTAKGVPRLYELELRGAVKESNSGLEASRGLE